MGNFQQTGVELVAKNAGNYIRSIDSAGKATSKFTTSLKSVGSIALKAGAVGLAAVGAGLVGAATAGFKFNSSMENVEAQLFAFLKDGGEVADTLAMIEERAAKTPFAFDDMARATASLIPAAKQSGQEITELIGVAEILAASNPAEGLEGAAFSLREALSGDFVSIVERFNLPRQRLKELKADGVPALEAVSIAMKELGLDAELVTNLSQTATGRLSTVKDNLLGIAAAFTEPFFEVFSQSLGTLIPKLETIRPIAENVAEAFSRAFKELASGAIPLENIANGFLMTLGVGRETRVMIQGMIVDTQELVNSGLLYLQENILPLVTGLITWKDVLIGLGIAIASVVVPALVSMALSVGAILLPLFAVIAAVAVVRTAWTENWFGIQEITATAIEFIKTAIATGLEAINQFWATHGETIMTVITTFWEFIKTRFDVTMTFLRNLTTAFTSALEGDWRSFGASLRAIVDGIWTSIKGAWNAGKAAILSITNSLTGDVKSTFTDIDWGEIGRNVVQGIANGITGAIGAVVAAAQAVGAAAKEAFEGFMGINSPAKIMIPDGEDTTEGVALGMRTAIPSVVEAGVAVGSAARSSVSEATYNPVATPSQQTTNNYNNTSTNVNFSANYASTPQVTDADSLTAIMAGFNA